MSILSDRIMQNYRRASYDLCVLRTVSKFFVRADVGSAYTTLRDTVVSRVIELRDDKVSLEAFLESHWIIKGELYHDDAIDAFGLSRHGAVGMPEVPCFQDWLDRQ